MSKPVMYIFANRGLGMSSGKLSAQVAHAAVESFLISDDNMVVKWRLGEHYTKLVMLARDNEHIRNIETYINKRGYKTALIIDEGITEISPHQPTALGVEIVDKEDQHTEDTFSTFELYKETVRIRMDIAK